MKSFATLRFFAIGATVVACGKPADQPPPASQATPPVPATPQKLGEIGGLSTPESVRYDAAHDVWFISNIAGVPSDKDGNGFITRVSGDRATVDTAFVRGGVRGVTLNAPKGLAIAGDTLWVTDIDAVRGFDVRTGAPVATIDLKPAGAVFLNDITVGPDRALYITDSGIRIAASGMTHPGPDRVFRIVGRAVTGAVTFTKAEAPNGIAFDGERGRFLIVPFASPTIFTWTAGATAYDSLTSGPGGYDGVEVLADGRALVSSWTDSTIHVLDGASLSPFIRGVAGPADIGIDTTRGVLAIPIFESGRVEFWTIPAR